MSSITDVVFEFAKGHKQHVGKLDPEVYSGKFQLNLRKHPGIFNAIIKSQSGAGALTTIYLCSNHDTEAYEVTGLNKSKWLIYFGEGRDLLQEIVENLSAPV